MPEKRHFSRIIFSAPAKLEQGAKRWQTHLLDLSLNGALVALPEQWTGTEQGEMFLRFQLSDSEIEISMEVSLSHQEASHLGLCCTHIDINSATHLKRLIELNVGDDALLHREMAQLQHRQPA